VTVVVRAAVAVVVRAAVAVVVQAAARHNAAGAVIPRVFAARVFAASVFVWGVVGGCAFGGGNRRHGAEQ